MISASPVSVRLRSALALRVRRARQVRQVRWVRQVVECKGLGAEAPVVSTGAKAASMDATSAGAERVQQPLARQVHRFCRTRWTVRRVRLVAAAIAATSDAGEPLRQSCAPLVPVLSAVAPGV